MAEIFNLIIQDRSDPRATVEWVESFKIREDIQQPETALRNAIKEFVNSGTEESKKALEYACGCFNWGDAISSVPDDLYIKHGLTKLNQESIDVYVDHDEILCDDLIEASSSEEEIRKLISVKIKKFINEYISDGNKDIEYWDRGQNLFAEQIADKIEKQNEKLKILMGMEIIDAEIIKNSIASETEPDIIEIYENILDYIEDIS